MYTEDYYSILGVERNATAEEIKNAYRLMCKVHHPDAGGDETLMKLLNKAYITLSDEKQRAKYDRTYSETPKKEPKQNTHTPPETVTAYVLEVDGSVTEKVYNKQKLKFDISKYQDENGNIYIYNDMRKGTSGEHIVLQQYAWEYKYAYHNRTAHQIDCYVFSEKDGDSFASVPICDLPLNYTDHINKDEYLFVVIYKNLTAKFFTIYKDWEIERNFILKKRKTRRIRSALLAFIFICIFTYAIYAYFETPSTPSSLRTRTTNTNITTSRNTKTKRTKCLKVKCNNPPHADGFTYCTEHKCNFYNCDFVKRNGNYCDRHKSYNKTTKKSTKEKTLEQPKITYEEETNCAYANCTNSIYYSSKYCYRHECNDVGCENPVIKNSSYCEQHKCRVPSCNNGLLCNDEYCSSHECLDSTCSNRRSGYSSYCTEHKCSNTNCTSSKSFNSDYCYLHRDF